jgi:hypothetical protein
VRARSACTPPPILCLDQGSCKCDCLVSIPHLRRICYNSVKGSDKEVMCVFSSLVGLDFLDLL